MNRPRGESIYIVPEGGGEMLKTTPELFREKMDRVEYWEKQKRSGFYFDQDRLRQETDQETNVWIKMRMEGILAKPLDDYGPDLQRLLLEIEWNNLVLSGYTYELERHGARENDLSQVPDEVIDRVFKEYRDDNYDYFLWQERSERRSKAEKGCEYLKDRYAIKNSDLEHLLHSDDPQERARGFAVLSGFTYTKLDPEHGAIYNPDGQLINLFSPHINPRA